MQKTIVSFFNANPPGTKITQEAVDHWSGTTVSLKRDGVVIGEALILSAVAEEDGVSVVYETEADLGIEMNLEFG